VVLEGEGEEVEMVGEVPEAEEEEDGEGGRRRPA
jgi:hypothetical protein